MEVSALKYSGGIRLHGRSSLLRLQSDDRLISFVRRGNVAAFEVLVGRYETRLLAFCRHLLGSREDAEDVLQEVFTAAFHALLADDRQINVRPWLFRIARNRSLNHLRRTQAIGVDSMDIHLSEHGASTADKVHGREEFRLLVGDIHELPETQRTALVLREMDALSYEQIAEVMETTVPSIKSLLVRARVSLAEAAEARLLSCEEVRIELGGIAEGLQRRPSPLVRRHLRTCHRCSQFKVHLRHNNKALAALLPIGPLAVLRKLVFVHLGHSAGAGSTTAVGSGAAAAGGGAAATSAVAGSTAGGFVTAGLGAVATKAAVGLAAAALVTGAAVEVDHSSPVRATHTPIAAAHYPQAATVSSEATGGAAVRSSRAIASRHIASKPTVKLAAKKHKTHKSAAAAKPTLVASVTPPPATTTTTATTVPPPGRTQTQTDPTVLASPTDTTASTTTTPPAAAAPATTTTPTATTAPVEPAPTTTTTTTTPPPVTTTTPTETTTTLPLPPPPPPTGP
jgi:RNA polymerase sigma factor (sigma-70 family)